jgi:hypothetical protein
MRLNREGGTVPSVRENQRMHQGFSLVNNNVLRIYFITGKLYYRK